jgi:CRISPR/Cas system endoribonuclease Cas6 (RAMP superfamily)
MYRYRMKNEIIKGMKGLFRNEKDEKIVNLIITLGFLY